MIKQFLTFPPLRYNTQSREEHHHSNKKEAQRVTQNFFQHTLWFAENSATQIDYFNFLYFIIKFFQ